ncbi:hypothetical protein [Paenibacillus andongensis]|uniref:hypothetical protein n=1 Tax=Paenibacillus andongensis TaxID=2975482 RepID=UPI0021BA99F7|nr:hypothetical protein [Paenibacillus andongensis]
MLLSAVDTSLFSIPLIEHEKKLFNRVKDQGMLASPTTIAEKLVDLLLCDQLAQGIVVEEL